MCSRCRFVSAATADEAAAQAEVLVRETLCSLAVGDDPCVRAIEVWDGCSLRA
jgi:hypothetical protein